MRFQTRRIQAQQWPSAQGDAAWKAKGAGSTQGEIGAERHGVTAHGSGAGAGGRVCSGVYSVSFSLFLAPLCALNHPSAEYPCQPLAACCSGLGLE